MADNVETSAIERINGYRLLALSSTKALQDNLGNDITATYLTKTEGNDFVTTTDLNTSGTAWNATTTYINTNSAGLEEVSGAVTGSSATWNTVSDKLDTTAFSTVSGNFATDTDLQEYLTTAQYNTDSGTFLTKASADVDYQAKGDYLSANALNSVSGTWDDASKWVTGNSADLATTSFVEQEVAKVGSFTTAQGTGADNHPNVQDPTTKTIYLVKDETAPNPDKYKEWICTNTATPTWELIGDTTMDMSNYQPKLIPGVGIQIDQNNNISVTSELTPYSGDDGIQIVDHVVSISANYLTANALNNYSGNWQNASRAVTANSSTWDNVTAKADSSVLNNYLTTSQYETDSATFLTTTGGYLTKASADQYYQPTGNYLTADALDSVSGGWNTAYTYVTANSANISSVSSTVATNSANWGFEFTVVELPTANP